MNTTTPAETDIRSHVLVQVGDSSEFGDVGIFHAAQVDLSRRWNGWLSAPMFTLDEAKRVIAYTESMREFNPESETVAYDAHDDVISITSDYGSGPETYSYGPTVVDGVKLYTIGEGAWTWSEYTEPVAAASASDVPDMVRRVIGEVLADIESGTIPPTVTSFSGLQDHVDANAYGGMADDESPLDWVNDRDGATAAVRAAVDVWLRAGRPPLGAIIPADVTAERPYYLTVRPFGDPAVFGVLGYCGAVWERNADGVFVECGTGARYDTEEGARMWAIRYAANATDEHGNVRAAAVVEV